MTAPTRTTLPAGTPVRLDDGRSGLVVGTTTPADAPAAESNANTDTDTDTNTGTNTVGGYRILLDRTGTVVSAPAWQVWPMPAADPPPAAGGSLGTRA